MPFAYLGDGIGLSQTRMGHKIFVDTADRSITPHLIADGEWEIWVTMALQRALRPGMTVVEVGCNMGIHTLAMASLIGPTGRLFGFEPNPAMFRLLSWSTEVNGFTDRVTLFNSAAYDTAGTASFEYNMSGPGGGNLVLLRPVSPGLTSLTVQMTTLDSALADVGEVQLLRIDAEGSEPAIIKGAAGVIALSPDLTIIMEWFPEGMTRCCGAESASQACTFLFDNGFECSRIGSGGEIRQLSAHELMQESHCDVIFRRTPRRGMQARRT